MKSSLLAVSVLLVAGLVTACGSADENNGANNGGKGGAGGNGNGGGDTGGGGNAGGNGGDGGNTGGTSAGGGNTGGANTGGTNTGGNSNVCGGKSGGTCEEDELCNYPDNMCGVTDGTGECAPKPQGDNCPDTVDQQVCGCDGTVYSNACFAEAAGVDVQSLGYCPPLEGKYPCGEKFCDVGSEYCQKQLSDVVGEPHSYSCNVLPGTCATGSPNCACLADVACGNNCEQNGDSIMVTCPGG